MIDNNILKQYIQSIEKCECHIMHDPIISKYVDEFYVQYEKVKFYGTSQEALVIKFENYNKFLIEIRNKKIESL